MKKFTFLKSLLLGSICALSFAGAVLAENFDIPGGDLHTALKVYSTQSGVAVVVSDEAIKGARTQGIRGDLSADAALAKILSGTGFTTSRDPSGVVEIIRNRAATEDAMSTHMAATSAPTMSGPALETVTVTSSKVGGDVQNIPISITALSQEQLTATQTAGGPDLIKQVPNMTFTKTNFSGYSIQLRGIGTQAISVTTDPAVAVAFNDIPFIRNHFFEQEFYDVSSVEVLRGPQGTLYGRNATAGVVNLASAKPTDQFEAMASADIGNYGNRRLEGMINLPIVDDRLDIRIAGEWTKRQGYSFNTITDSRIDGRDLWSGRLSIGWKPIEEVQATLIWEHFSEDDDRMRTAKQLCKTDHGPLEVNGVAVPRGGTESNGGAFQVGEVDLSQGCIPTSLYSPDAFQVPDGFAIPYVVAAGAVDVINPIDPYASTTQSHNLRVIESTLNPSYKAKNDTVELNSDYAVSPMLTFTSQTGFDHDFLWSTEDYNRFNTAPGIFRYIPPGPSDIFSQVSAHPVMPDGFFCDPQLGCANRLVAQDLSDEHAWQLNQEFRLASNFTGPLNFSVGGNYMHYETEENYYVFVNALSLFAINSYPPSLPTQPLYVPGVTDHRQCLPNGFQERPINSLGGGGTPTEECIYIDPNPIAELNGNGHNYFLSKNPYLLNSYATFGEFYYNLSKELKLTAGLRWTEDQKHFTDIPSQAVTAGWGYPVSGVVNQQWDQFTGRAVANWTPKLDFTDQTLVYTSYAHGYKGGGANPPGAVFGGTAAVGAAVNAGITIFPIHPFTFKPEFVDAFEVGSKNTLLDGTLTINADVFYYNYENYQISEIVDRTSINLNFDAHVKGAEIESTWEPLPGLRFNFAGGWEDTALAKGAQAIDLMDRTDSADHPDWLIMKPFATEASNCIFPAYVVEGLIRDQNGHGGTGQPQSSACGLAYTAHLDPITELTYVANPTLCFSGQVGNPTACGGQAFEPPAYQGFDPASAPNNGEGFDKNLSGNELPNAPPFTVSFGAQYTMPLTTDWAGTLRGDYYWQDYSWARIFNDNPYDRVRGYTNINLSLIFTSQTGWQVMLYDKNVFNTTAITGTFLNSDDSGLTTNVFLTDPKLIGIRVTKNW